MLDRISAGLISLPVSSYDVIVLLNDPTHSSNSTDSRISRTVMAQLFAALKEGGVLKSQDGTLGHEPSAEKTEAILAGFLLNQNGNGMMKPVQSAVEGVVLLKRGAKRGPGASIPKPVDAPVNLGVGFVDGLDVGDDDELIDEDDLLTEEDKTQGIVQRKFLHFFVLNTTYTNVSYST
jgi:hypothetical protein